MSRFLSATEPGEPTLAAFRADVMRSIMARPRAALELRFASVRGISRIFRRTSTDDLLYSLAAERSALIETRERGFLHLGRHILADS
jgi:hypothetical protein